MVLGTTQFVSKGTHTHTHTSRYEWTIDITANAQSDKSANLVASTSSEKFFRGQKNVPGGK